MVGKPVNAETAEECFQHTGIKITSQGARILGAAMCTRSFAEKFDKVASWISEVKNLSVIAKTHPQAAYAAFTHGQSSKWNFLMCTIPDIGAEFQLLEDAIMHHFLLAITGRQVLSNAERELMALPVRLGGLGIPILMRSAPSQLRLSLRISDPLVSLIIEQSPHYPGHSRATQKAAKATVRIDNRDSAQEQAKALRPQLVKSHQFRMDQASKKGASSWMTALLIQEFGFCLHKQAFRDALCVRYR